MIALKMTLPLRRAGMATTGNLSEEQVHCSICLDVFTNPVSIPCGHNFCQGCILGYWKTSPLYQCPMCKKSFYKRPDISINTVLREIAEQFKEIRVRSVEEKASNEEEEGKVEEENKWKMERHKQDDEERLLERDQKEQLLEELKQKQEEDRRRKEKEKAGENKPMQEELPPLIPSVSAPKPSPRFRASPQATAQGAPPPLPQTSPPPSPAPTPPPSSSSSLPLSSWEEVLCDVCLGQGRPKAVKSCLVCLTSYCEEHLRSHAARFTKHKLIEPVANMEDRMCPKHQRLLELFCKKDQTCVCVLCTETDHRSHYTVPVEREWMEKKVSGVSNRPQPTQSE